MGTIRFRLTFWYAALFALAGIALLALVYLLVERQFPEHDPGFVERVSGRPGMQAQRGVLESLGFFEPSDRGPGPREPVGDRGRAAVVDFVEAGRQEARDQALDTLLAQSSVGLGVMLVLAVGAGWVVSGRMLRPVSNITSTVRRIDGERLDERVALDGPRDELKELADQFDAMLDRLDEAFRAQREFVANASHELRTPLAVMRAELDVTFGNTLDNVEASPEEVRASADVLRRAVQRSEALIAALLTLERADAPRTASTPLDLAERAAGVLDQHVARATEAGVEVRRDLRPAPVAGDPVLLERMVENLVSNALAYNIPAGGWLEVTTAVEGDHTVIRVANSGPPVPPESADALFERFRRGDPSRSRETGGHGLGLAIVRAVARHHGGDASATARVEGGLVVEVALPRA